MHRGLTGYYFPVSALGETCRAFVPHPLPPNPPLDADEELKELNEAAALAVGRLDGITLLLPDPALFLYAYVRKEAVLSSQIEGTQSSLSDLLLFEMQAVPGVPVDDVQEVSNYVAALQYGLKRIQEGLPISLRLIKEIHAVLLAKGRGSSKEPGEFRRSQNWVGGSRPGNALYVPPPADHLMDCLGALEKFLHNDPVKTPLLIKAALAHVQFETIHPFLDGNGRLGRLLITLLLCVEGALREPMLYLSLYFKQHRQQYYDLLQSTRLTGDWEGWVKFFLTGVRDTATQATETARRLLALFKTDHDRVSALGRPAGTAVRLHHFLQSQPVTTIAAASTVLHVAPHTIAQSFERLARLGIVHEITGGKYGRVFAYREYVSLLTSET